MRQRFPKFELATILYGLVTVQVPQTWVIKPTMWPFGGHLSASAPIERGSGTGEISAMVFSCMSSGETNYEIAQPAVLAWHALSLSASRFV